MELQENEQIMNFSHNCLTQLIIQLYRMICCLHGEIYCFAQASFFNSVYIELHAVYTKLILLTLSKFYLHYAACCLH